ncbi:MAG: hypothetical protein A2Y17_12050 [Clostridiales bacterium GWF2_38_85]|nr:MAG: hypothetical protein A2Y17_12050 [Clostridiales bacterium GWF2_38_85]
MYNCDNKFYNTNTTDNRNNYVNNYDKDKDNCCYVPKHPKAKGILLECGCNPQDAFFEIDHGKVKCDQSFILDNVLVDTTCLCKPLIKFEFSCLIYFEAEIKDCRDKEIEVELEFELIRLCKGEKECIRSWKYLKEFEISENKFEVEISEPFTVTFCDKTCSDCCEYKMLVKGKDFEGDFEALRVTKPNLSAFAQGLCD